MTGTQTHDKGSASAQGAIRKAVLMDDPATGEGLKDSSGLVLELSGSWSAKTRPN